MGMLKPLAFEVACAQARICVRNPEAARPAIALRKKDLLFMRWDVGRAGVGRQRVFPPNDARVRGELLIPLV